MADRPTVTSDFYEFEHLLDDQDRAALHRVRAFMDEQVEPIINEWWTRAQFPRQLIPGLAELGIAGAQYAGHGSPGRSSLFDGMVSMELGNGSFADLVVIWARDVETDRVLGFVVETPAPGFSAVDLEDKIALRAVQNALITLDGVRVPEENRLQEAHGFRSTADVLRMTRASVAWSAVGCSRGAYEHALRYAKQRNQFGRPIVKFQLVQDLLVRMLGNITASAAMCTRLSRLQDAGRMTDE